MELTFLRRHWQEKKYSGIIGFFLNISEVLNTLKSFIGLISSHLCSVKATEK